jgi:hypothetical protein
LPLASEVSSQEEHTHVVDAGGYSVFDTVKRKFREAVTLRNEREEEREVRARINQTEKDNDFEVEEPPEPNSIAQADQASEVGPQISPVDQAWKLELAKQQAEFDAAKKKYALFTKFRDQIMGVIPAKGPGPGNIKKDTKKDPKDQFFFTKQRLVERATGGQLDHRSVLDGERKRASKRTTDERRRTGRTSPKKTKERPSDPKILNKGPPRHTRT